jgi:hypothetical protein
MDCSGSTVTVYWSRIIINLGKSIQKLLLKAGLRVIYRNGVNSQQITICNIIQPCWTFRNKFINGVQCSVSYITCECLPGGSETVDLEVTCKCCYKPSDSKPIYYTLGCDPSFQNVTLYALVDGNAMFDA